MITKPSDKEEEFFARQEFERLRKLQEERQKQIAENEKRRLKELHFMRCPKCGMELKEIDYKGVKIDKCFTCEGVWLDAGELESVSKMEKSASDRMFRLFGKK
jgi:hypothetical protein